MRSGSVPFGLILLFSFCMILLGNTASALPACINSNPWPVCGGGCAQINPNFFCNATLLNISSSCVCDCPYFNATVVNQSNTSGTVPHIRVVSIDENTNVTTVELLDEYGNVVTTGSLSPDGTLTYVDPRTGRSVTVRYVKPKVQINDSASWAEVSILSEEITLQDGLRYNLASSVDMNWRNVYTSLLWKNRDGTPTDTQADSLREIALYVDDLSNYMDGNNRMKPGDSVAFPKTSSLYRLTYNGLDLSDSEYVRVQVRSDSIRVLGMARADNCNIQNGTNSWNSSLIRISSDTDDVFGGSFSDALGGDIVSEFYVDPIGGYNTSRLGPQTQNTSAAQWGTQIFWAPPGCTYYKSATLPPANNGAGNLGKNMLTVDGGAVSFGTGGDDSAAPGLLEFYFVRNANTQFNLAANDAYSSSVQQPTSAPYIMGEIVLQEDAGKLNTMPHHIDMLRIPVYNFTNPGWGFKYADSSTDVTYYNSLNLSANTVNSLNPAASYELPLYTERGTKVLSVSSGVSISAANRVGRPTFTFDATGSHVFKTLITDSIDKTTRNRMNTLSEDNYTAWLASPDSTTNILSPLRGAYENFQIARNLYRIGSAEVSDFADYATTDQQAPSGFDYNEKQGYWVGTGAPSYDGGTGVYYDSGSLYRQVIARPQIIVYNNRFLGNDYGIPVCTEGLSNANDWTSCTQNRYRTAFHRLKIKFLGEEWIITNMTKPTTPLANGDGAVTGGLVKLGKELDYRIISVGEMMGDTPLRIRLVRVNQDGSAVFDVIDSNGNVVGQVTVRAGQTYTFTQSQTGQQIKIHLLQTGYSNSPATNKSAEFRLYGPCPQNRSYNLNSCSCVCSNQTAISECVAAGNQWNWSSCTCIKQNLTCEQSTVPACFGSCTDSKRECGVKGPACKCLCSNTTSIFLSIGGTTVINGFTVRLADISVSVGTNNTHPAIFDILDENGTVIGQIQVTPGDTYTFTRSQDGKQFKVHVSHTSGGLTLSDKWVEILLNAKDCPPGKTFNENTCTCECANQTAKLECATKGGTWNDVNCSCTLGCEQSSVPACFGECTNKIQSCMAINSNATLKCGCECKDKLYISGALSIDSTSQGWVIRDSNGNPSKLLMKVTSISDSGAVISFYDDKGNYLGNIDAKNGGTYSFTDPDSGEMVTLRILGTHIGSGLPNDWADMRIYLMCPSGKTFNDTTCSCACSNQTAKAACKYPDTWDEKTCTCKSVSFCGRGGDAGFCQKDCPISTFTCQANNTSPSGCQCACEQTFSCPIPKSFNNDVCACECPGMAKNIVNISNEISGKNFKIKLVSIDTSVYPPTAKLEVYDMNGNLLWTFDRVKAADNYVPFNGKLNFKVLRISDDGKWAEIVIYKDDCPDNKVFNADTCACTCSQNEKFACESKGGRWNDTNCTCNYNACSMQSNLTCGGDCPANQQCEMMEQIGTPEEGSVRICGCVQKCAGAGSADLPIAQMPVQMQNGNYCQDNCPSGTFCSPDKCICEKPVVLCSKGQRYSNRTCGVDDCPTNQFCEPTSCTCKPLVDTCGPSRNYSKDEPISNRGGSFCSGYCANKAKSCWLYGANGPSDGGYSSWLDADCICECARPQSVEAGYWVGGGMGTGAISPKEFYPDGSARVWLSNLVTDPYPPPETVIREGDIAEYTHPDGGKTYFKIIRIRGNASGGGYISIVSGDCPNGSVYDFTKCACVPVPSIQPWLPVLVQQTSDSLHKVLSSLAPSVSVALTTASHPIVSTLTAPSHPTGTTTTTPTQPTVTTTTTPTQPTVTTPNLTAYCSAGNWKSGMQCVNNCPTNYTCNSNCTCIKNAAKNGTSETPITLSVPAGRVGLSATITASGMKSGESVTFTISGTGPKPVTATKYVIASRGQASTFVVCVRKESIPITACVANSRCATAVLQCN